MNLKELSLVELFRLSSSIQLEFFRRSLIFIVLIVLIVFVYAVISHSVKRGK